MTWLRLSLHRGSKEKTETKTTRTRKGAIAGGATFAKIADMFSLLSPSWTAKLDGSREEWRKPPATKSFLDRDWGRHQVPAAWKQSYSVTCSEFISGWCALLAPRWRRHVDTLISTFYLEYNSLVFSPSTEAVISSATSASMPMFLPQATMFDVF